MSTFNTRVRTAAQWASANPVLPVGQIGFESDTGRSKFGNGRDRWAVLDYAGQVWGADLGTALIRPAPGSTTPTTLGCALTGTGTATAATLANTSLYTRLPRLDYLVTTPSTSAVAGFRGGGLMAWRGDAAGRGGFTVTLRWGAATGVSTGTHRAFCGLRNTTSAPTDVEPSGLTDILGMGWDAADTEIQFMHNDGSGAATEVPLGASFPVPTADRSAVYELKMTCEPNGSSIGYRVTNLTTGAVASGSVSSNIPSATTFLNLLGYCSVGGTSSVVGFTIFPSHLYANP